MCGLTVTNNVKSKLRVRRSKISFLTVLFTYRSEFLNGKSAKVVHILCSCRCSYIVQLSVCLFIQLPFLWAFSVCHYFWPTIQCRISSILTKWLHLSALEEPWLTTPPQIQNGKPSHSMKRTSPKRIQQLATMLSRSTNVCSRNSERLNVSA